MSPAVSVILPTHNRATMLRRAMDSVLGQTFADFELIVVDDGSPDDTRAVVQGQTDSRVRYLRLDVRGGPARARNAGIRLARAPLLAFQDSDDVWLPEKLRLQLALLERSPARTGLIGAAYELVEPAGTRVVRSAALERGTDYGCDLVRGIALITPLWLVRRSALEQAGMFDERLASSEDYELAFRLADVCDLRAVPDVVLRKTGHAASLSSDNRLLVRGLETVYARHAAHWRPFPAEELALFERMASLHLRTGSRAAAARTLLRAFMRHPSRHLAWRAAALLFGREALRRYIGSAGPS
jgi:glycosyltransferase involved in cell wall biosynthesis